MTVDGILAALDDQQREAAETLRGPVCVLAGAGTGKTRVITHRIAHGVETGAFSPQRVMAVTFTTKAAGEMRGRLRALGVDGVAARTFHSAALRQLNYFWPTVAGDSAPAIVDSKVRLLAHAAETVGARADAATLRDVASAIEWRKVSMHSIDTYAVLRPATIGGLDITRIVDVMRAYEKLKDERRQLDFEDVLLACAGMLEAEPRVTASVREQYRHFTVDEYQDVSPLQQRVLDLWLGDRRDLCVVGDASQTVFSFAGADPRYLLEFGQRHPDAHVVKLERSYRSTPSILAVANALMRDRPGALRLIAAGAETVGAGSVRPTVSAHRDELSEATTIARRIEGQIAAGIDPRDIAVLYRINSQSAAIIEALAGRGIAAQTMGGKRFFDLPEVRQALLALRGASVASGHTDLVTSVRDVLRSLGLADEPPPAGGAVRDAWEARRALLRLAEDAPEGTSLRAFTDDLQSRARDQHEPATRTVTLATLHAAKGLEWHHVHLAGLSEGQLPISYATTIDEVAEERRLTYVGITRAARTLSVTWVQGEGHRERRPSRFLAEIGRDNLDVVDGRATSASSPRRAL